MFKVKLIVPVVVVLSLFVLNISRSQETHNKSHTDIRPAKSFFTLYQNKSTEFKNVTGIRFDLRSEAYVTLNVFDRDGMIIENLVDTDMAPGQYVVYFKTSGKTGGEDLSYKIEVDGIIETKTIVNNK